MITPDKEVVLWWWTSVSYTKGRRQRSLRRRLGFQAGLTGTNWLIAEQHPPQALHHHRPAATLNNAGATSVSTLGSDFINAA